MYLSWGAFVTIKSRLSRTFCAVTRGPKKYHEHQPVGGVLPRIGGWFVARRRVNSARSCSRSDPALKENSSRLHDSPGLRASPSVSTTTCNDELRRYNCPPNRRDYVN